MVLFSLDENKIGDEGMRILAKGGDSMPNMEEIRLGTCIRYKLDWNNIRIPLMISKVP